MLVLRKGRHLVRWAETAADLLRAQQLRHHAFVTARHGTAVDSDARDADAFDAACRHVLVEEASTGRLVCCFRLLPLTDGTQVGRSYSAQFYDLSALKGYRGRMAEIGRFCIDPSHGQDPDILRVAWAALARMVDAEGVEMLFGCSSFEGTETGRYLDAFALLRDRHLAPPGWRPRIKAPRVFPYALRLQGRRPDPKRALLTLPPLLRGYLALGGWVSDHAVVDCDLNTLHVFTGLEIASIPAARARSLRAAAA